MAKLKKREIIILVIAALFVLYAGYEYLIAGPASKKVKTSASADSVKVDTFISGITNDLGKDKYRKLDSRYKLNKINLLIKLFDIPFSNPS